MDQQSNTYRLIRLLGKGSFTEVYQGEPLPPSPRFHNLPTPLTSLIGREQECAAVEALLMRFEVRILTLTGTGGIGKTRLALEVSTHLLDVFADGACFVSLAPISNPDLVIPTIAQTLGVKELGTIPLVVRLKNFLCDKHLLLILDNFEQVIDAAPHLTELLIACQGVKILMTSRAVLHIQGEHEFPIPPLPLPDLNHLPAIEDLMQSPVIRLFMQRGQAVKPNFQITSANARSIAEICVRLDGLPLAIELAAARIKLLPPQALLVRLENRLQILTGGKRDLPARQQTLRDTLAWSYDLLNVQEQRLFRHLSVFVGGCSLEAVEAVCATLGDITVPLLDVMTSLLDKSLILQIEHSNDEPRLFLLETIREYGVECMATHEEVARTRYAHAKYYLELATEAEFASYGADQMVWLDRQELENDNVRAALRWLLDQKERETALRLGGTSARFWFLRGYLREGLHWLAQGLEGSEHVAAEVRAKSLYSAGVLAGLLSDQERSEALCHQGLELCQELGDTRGQTIALWMLGRIAAEKNNYATARMLGERALAVARKADDGWGMALSFQCLGVVAFYQGEYEQARALFADCLQHFKALGDIFFVAEGYRRLAEIFFAQGDDLQAQPLIEECLALTRKVGVKWGIAWSLSILGQIALHREEYDQAQTLLEECLAIHKEVWDQKGISQAYALLARVATAQQDYPTARALYEESLELARKIGDKWSITSYLEGLGETVAAQGEAVWAARLWGAAEKLRQEIGTPRLLVACVNYERIVAIVRARLGDALFQATWLEGRGMSPEQVLVSQTPLPALKRDASIPPAPAGLTKRELEVLQLVAQGLTNALIAEQLVISYATVNSYLRSIYSKLGVSTRTGAMRYAVDHHLI